MSNIEKGHAIVLGVMPNKPLSKGIITIACSHCGNPELEMNTEKVYEVPTPTGKVVNYSAVCKSCGSSVEISEAWKIECKCPGISCIQGK